MADDLSGLYGDYDPPPDVHYGTTPRQGLAPMAKQVIYTPVCMDGTPCKNYNESAGWLAVQMSQITVLCLGTGR